MDITIVLFIWSIILIGLGFFALAIKWGLDYKLKRAETEGSSLGTSELRGLIQEAMLDAVVPLEERLDLIETHLRQLPEHEAGPAALELPEPVDPTES